ncbi:MAG: hypothetical protein QNK11_02070, partial [Legionella sp.]|nr:hypothetical protein [Legionella sp.]
NRMTAIADIIEKEGELLGCDVISPAVYSEDKKALTFTWAFKAGQLDKKTSDVLLSALKQYADITMEIDNRADDINPSDYYDAMQARHSDNQKPPSSGRMGL